MNITQLESRILNLDDQIQGLVYHRDQLKRKLCEEKSRKAISDLGIKPEDVERSSGDGKEWFGTVHEFGKWLKETNCEKKYYEWNTGIYLTSEIIEGEFSNEPIACIDQLPTKSEEQMS